MKNVVTNFRFLTLLLLSLVTSAFADPCACVIDYLHVRAGAGTSYKILGTMVADDCYTDKGGRQTANGFTWANLDYNGHVRALLVDV